MNEKLFENQSKTPLNLCRVIDRGIAAYTLKSAIDYYELVTGETADVDSSDVYQFTDEQLDNIIDDIDENGQLTGEKITIRSLLENAKEMDFVLGWDM